MKKKRHVGIMLELIWPYRRHLDVFAGTQRFAQDHTDWQCEIEEFHADDGRSHSQLAGYDGLIARASEELAYQARRAKVPLVNVLFNSPVRDRLPGAFPDFAKIGTTAGEHLVDRGFRRFGCLSIPHEGAHKMMVGAFHDVVHEHGCRCQCRGVGRFYYRTGKSWSRFQQHLDDWIATWTPPIALFIAFNDVTIRYVVNACRRHGLRVPEDVALIGATNEPNIGAMPPPSLSSIEVNYEQIGYHAAHLLHKLMRGRKLAQKHVIVPPTGVVARDSTDFFAVEDEAVALAMRFIERNANREIDVDHVADATGVARRTLERRFRASSGRSIAKEILRLRLLKAKRLLAETDLPVKQIALETGFRDPVRMYEVFIREEEMTPSDYRRHVRDEV